MRGHGEGSVYETPHHRWRCQISLPGGRRVSKTFATRREASAWRLRVLTAIRDGALIAPERITVADFLRRWLRDVVAHKCRPRTQESYESVARVHLIPALGEIQLSELRADHVQALLANVATDGRSPRTVQYIHSVLHRALRYAVKWELVARNVCDLVEPPRQVRREMRTLMPVQVAMLLEVAKDGNLYVLILTAVTTGMREGELLGLRWQDVDLDAGTLHVVNTVQPVRGVGMVDVEPKTASSRRLIMLAPSVVAALRRHRSAQLRVGGYVFCMASGKAIHPSNLVKAFKALLVEAGLPAMRFHDLRHSCASLLLAANVHPRVVQELLGHSQIALTLQTYSHTLPTMGAEVAARMEEVVQNACNSPKNPERSAHDITAGRVG